MANSVFVVENGFLVSQNTTSTLTGTLSVTGAATLSNTLNVVGAANLQSTANVASTLGVVGAAALSNTISVTGAATLSNTLNVVGGANLQSTANIAGTLGVVGATSVTTLTASGIGSFTAGNGGVTLTPANTASSARTNIYWAAKNSTGDVRSTYFGSNISLADGSTELDAQETLNLMINGVVKTALTSTGLAVAGTLTAGAGTFNSDLTIRVDGSSGVTGHLLLSNDAGTRIWNQQLNAAGDATDWYHYNGSAWTKYLSLSSSTGLATNGALSVTGATTLSNTLSVVGNSAFSNTLTISGKTTVNADLDVNPAFGLGVYISPATDANGTASVLRLYGGANQYTNRYVEISCFNNGGSNVNEMVFKVGNVGTILEAMKLAYNGAVTIPGTISVTGAATLSNTMSVAGNATFSGGFANVIGNLRVGGNLDIVGNVAYSGVVTGDLIGGVASSIGNTTNRWAFLYVNNISTSETITVGSNVTINTSSIKIGNSTVNSVITSTSIFSNGTLSIVGAATLSSTINVTGAATLSNTVVITGAATLSNTISVTGNTTFSNTVAVTGATTFANNVTISGTLTTAAINATAVFVKLSAGAANLVTLTSNSMLVDNQFTTNTNPILVDSSSSTEYGAVKYVVRAFNGSNTAQTAVSEILIVHDGSATRQTEFAQVNTVSNFVTYLANVDSGTLRLFANSNISNTKIRVSKTLIA